MKHIRLILLTNKTNLFRVTPRRKSAGIVMGSKTYKNHMENINKYLVEFEREPKKIEGNVINKWFVVGENLFKEFYYLGTSVKWNLSEIKKNEIEMENIVSLIAKNQGWLQSFITIYPGLRIDLDGCSPAVDVCQVRSGIEVLLQGFVDINEKIDRVLKDLKELGELDEFDDHLTVWKESHRPDFFPEDCRADTPESHWWWF